ncbi:MAG: hypothetical protein ACREA9_07225, partial [Pyrinomonadaceae bacterium]
PHGSTVCLPNMKATKDHAEPRLQEIIKIRLAGATFSDIRPYAAENGWNLADRTLWHYVKKSNEALAQHAEKTRDELINRHLGQRRKIYAKCVAGGDYTVALAALKDEANLLGLYPEKGQSEKPATTQTNVTLNVLTIDQRRAELLGIIDSLRDQSANGESAPTHHHNGNGKHNGNGNGTHGPAA